MSNLNASQVTQTPILGTPLLYQVNADNIGKAVPIQNQRLHNLAVQGANFGSGTVAIEWSLDGTTWSPLLGTDGKAITFTQNGLVGSLSINGIYLRASLSGSTGAQNVTVTLN
jgi:hypothetical protein